MLADVLRGGAADDDEATVEASHDHVFVFGDLNYRLDADALLASAAKAAPQAPVADVSADGSGADEHAEAPLLPPDASPRVALRDAAAAAAAAFGLGAAEAGAAAAESRDAAWRAAVASVTAGSLEALARSDELQRSIAAGDALPGYREGHVAAFAPTFKLEPPLSGAKGALQRAEACATGAVLPRGYATKRVPAWTDRCVASQAGHAITCALGIVLTRCGAACCGTRPMLRRWRRAATRPARRWPRQTTCRCTLHSTSRCRSGRTRRSDGCAPAPCRLTRRR